MALNLGFQNQRAPRGAAPKSNVFVRTGACGTSASRGKPDLGWVRGVLDGVSGILNVRAPRREEFADDVSFALAGATYQKLMQECRKGDQHPQGTPWAPPTADIKAPHGFETMPAGEDGRMSFIPTPVPGNHYQLVPRKGGVVNPAEIVQSLRLAGLDDDAILETLSGAGVENAEDYLLKQKA